jgi:hypothetical protein
MFFPQREESRFTLIKYKSKAISCVKNYECIQSVGQCNVVHNTVFLTPTVRLHTYLTFT